MSLDLLKEDIETRSFRRIYYFYGSESYLKRYYVKSLTDAILGDNKDTDLHRYEGKNLEVDSFSEELWLFPMGEYKVLLISDLPNTGSVTEFLAEEDCEIGDDTVVIVYQQIESPDLRLKSVKALKARVEKDGLFLDIKTLDDATLARWVSQQFRRHGCEISSSDVSFFLSVEERNMERMLTEIEKISSYCNGTVTREALEKLCVRTLQARAYELNDLILAKNGDKAFALLHDLWALRTPPQMILGSLFSCFAGLYRIKLMEGAPQKTLEELSGMKQKFLVSRYASTLKNIPLERLERLMDLCGEIDVLSKSSRIDGELLVVRLIEEALEIL